MVLTSSLEYCTNNSNQADPNAAQSKTSSHCIHGSSPLERLPAEVRIMIWKFVLGDARVKVKEVNYKTGPTPADYTGYNEQLRKMSPPDSHTRAYVTTYPGGLLGAFTALRCIKTVKNEFESTFFKFVLFDGNNIFPMAPIGPLSIDTSRIKRLHTESRCLGDILRVRYSLITDYTTASNHRVILPDFRALEYLSIREFCAADVYHSQDYDSRFPHVTKLMHFKRLFEVDVSIGVSKGSAGRSAKLSSLRKSLDLSIEMVT